MNFTFILNSQKNYEITLNIHTLKSINDDIFQHLINDRVYYVKSNVNEESFQSFVDYLSNDIIPDIEIDNFHDFVQLSQEFEVLTDLILEKKNQFGEFIVILNAFKSEDIKDKSYLEIQISQKLDIYLEKYGDKMMALPIHHLYNIFHNKERKLFNHELAYNIICEHYKKSNDSSIFILLNSLDGTKMSKNSLEESLLKLNESKGFHPEIDFSNLLNIFENHKINEINIEKLTNEINKMKSSFANHQNEMQKIQNSLNNEIIELKKQIELKTKENKILQENQNQKIQESLNKLESNYGKNLDLINELEKQKDEEIISIRNSFNNLSLGLQSFQSNFQCEINNKIEFQDAKYQKIQESLNKLESNYDENSNLINELKKQIELKTKENKILQENQNQKIQESLNKLNSNYDKNLYLINELKKQKDEEIISLRKSFSSLSIDLQNIKSNFQSEINSKIGSQDAQYTKIQYEVYDLIDKYKAQSENLKSLNQKIYSDIIYKNDSFKEEIYSIFSDFACNGFKVQSSYSEQGILDLLKSNETNKFDPPFIASMSSCDIYNLIDPNTEDDFGFGGDGDFFIDFELEEAVNINGFKICTSKSYFPRSFDIQVDGNTVKSVKNNEQLNGPNKETIFEIEPINGCTVRILQTGPNWDKGNNFIDIKRFEILSCDEEYSSGVFTTMMNRCKTKNPHKCPVHITSKQYDFNRFFKLDSKCNICTSDKENSWFQIEFTHGLAVINGFRLKRSPINKLKKYKIICSDDDKKPLDSWTTLCEIEEEEINENGNLVVYDIDRPSPLTKFVRIIQTGPNWNQKNYMIFFHFDIFGAYI